MITFASPWWFLILPLPVFVYTYLDKKDFTAHSGFRVPFFAALKPLIARQATHLTVQKRLWVAYWVWGLLVVATANPQWVGEPTTLAQHGRDVLLVLDISGSMQIPDLTWEGRQVDRLTVVKALAKQFVLDRKGDRLGLILFGSRAYLQTPLTFDLSTVQYMLDDATIGLAGPETAIGDAIGLAIKRLRHQPEKGRILVLLTDGANNAGLLKPLDAAKLANDAHIRIYTIGLGADELAVPGLLGTRMINPSYDLDEKTLQQIARITGGLYYRAKNTEGLAAIYQQINNVEPIVSDDANYRPATAYYWIPLMIAYITSLLLALRKLVFVESWLNNM